MGISSFAVVTIAEIQLELKGSAPRGQKTASRNQTCARAKKGLISVSTKLSREEENF